MSTMRSRIQRGKTVGHTTGVRFTSTTGVAFTSKGYIQLKVSLREGTREKLLWVLQISLFVPPRAPQKSLAIVGHTLSRIYPPLVNPIYPSHENRHPYFCKTRGLTVVSL